VDEQVLLAVEVFSDMAVPFLLAGADFDGLAHQAGGDDDGVDDSGVWGCHLFALLGRCLPNAPLID